MRTENTSKETVNAHTIPAATQWVIDPKTAFKAFVTSTDYKESSLRQRRADTISNDSTLIYMSMFARFVQFMDEHNVNIFTVSADHIYRFLTRTTKSQDEHSLARNEEYILQSGIQSRYIRLLERTFTYLNIFPRPTDNLLFGELKGLYKLKGKNKNTLTLTDAQVDAFLHHLPTYDGVKRKSRISNEWRVLRDRAMQCMLLGAGLKVAEVIALNMDELDPTVQLDGTLKINLTNNAEDALAKHPTFYEHTTFVQAKFTADILRWLKMRATLHITSDLVFPNNHGLLLDKASVYRQVKKTFIKANISVARLGGRTLRNTFAINELKNGTSDEELMGKLGLFEDRSLDIYQEALEKQ